MEKSIDLLVTNAGVSKKLILVFGMENVGCLAKLGQWKKYCAASSAAELQIHMGLEQR